MVEHIFGTGRNPERRDRASWRRPPGNGIHLSVLFLLLISIPAALPAGCGSGPSDRSVVVYTSVDQHYSEPVFKAFEEETGIQVKAVYDVEATKTTGLVNRLIAEKDRPLADVFWNGEFVQTLLLKAKGCLAPYDSPRAERIPPQYRDEKHYWTGFAGRARVLIVNTECLAPEDVPVSLFDLLSPRWPGEKIGIAYPLFGTTATHAAALFASMGPERGRAFFQGLRNRDVQVLDGNSVVKDLVVSGRLWMGLTDTDDACSVKERGKPVRLVFLDQGKDAMGTLIIPNTVALIAGAPHKEEAERLIDYLLSDDVEKDFIRSGWCHTPISGVEVHSACIQASTIRGMDTHLIKVSEQLRVTKKDLTEIFVR